MAPGMPAAESRAAPEVRVPWWRRRRLLLALAAGAALLAYAGYRLYAARRPYEWSGTVEAREISVGSRVGGRVREVLAREGERVRAGQPLVTLEPGDLEGQRLQAEGQLRQAEAELERLERGPRPEEVEQARARAAAAQAAHEKARAGARREEVARAAAQLRAAQAAFDKAQLDARRASALSRAGAIPRSELDAAEAALKDARAQRDASRAALVELQRGNRKEDIAQAASQAREAQANAELVEAGAREEDLRAQRGVVEAARGKLAAVLAQLDELTIRAPRDARVESLDLRPGDILPPGAPAATLLEEGQLYVRIYVPETRIGKIHVGDTVPIKVDSFPGRTFPGVVEHISSVGEYTPRNLQTADERANQVFATRVGLKDGTRELRAGMAAFITVPK